MYTRILDTNEPVFGVSFRLTGGLPIPGVAQDVLSPQEIMVDIHAGGIWELEQESPGGLWVGTGITFSDIGIKAIWANQDSRYRIAGGTTGARAYATGVWNLGV